ncbi:MAG: radical SAM protein [Planctomycetota bacterium]
MTRVRDYQYYDFTLSICSTCLQRVDAKILFQDDKVWMQKHCLQHGKERVLIADDVAYYRQARERFLKPSEMPNSFQTPVKYGCPYDCGLCPDHEQHSCVTLIELGERCNLSCPVCYAESGPHTGGFHDYDKIVRMLDAVVASEGEPDVVQLSGGEPTLHPEFFRIMDAARERPIRHLMINTNGLRIAQEPGFAERLAEYMPGLEIYLQFDSLEEEPLRQLRGGDLRDVRAKALERLNALGLSTTLVVTLVKGLNDQECGRIIDYAMQQPAVRGVTFQPMQDAGRVDLSHGAPLHEASPDRLILTEVRNNILAQTDVFTPDDIMPVPCHPDCIAMAYALKTEQGPVPLTGLFDPQMLMDHSRNTITFEGDPRLQQKLFDMLSTAHSPDSSANSLADLLCCLPQFEVPDDLGYDRVFRVVIMRFLDAHDFDVRSIKKSCVHVVHPEDGRLIPLETYNLFYRGELERTVLAKLRGLREVEEV